MLAIPSGNYFSIFALRRRSPANRRRFADDRRLSSIFAGSSPSFRLNFRRRFAFENRRRNEGDFKTFFFRSAGDPPATIEQFFDCRRRNEGEMKAKIEKIFENPRRNEGEIFGFSPANHRRPSPSFRPRATVVGESPSFRRRPLP